MSLFPFTPPRAALSALSVDASPTPVRAPSLVVLNTAFAVALGLDPEGLSTDRGIAILAGNQVPEARVPQAMAYAGHQFGGFVPLLGDGRAIWLGELGDGSGSGWQLQLKGAGRTPFSRGGSDGRAWLGPVLREYVVSEAMHALGIPTTRALAAVRTGQSVLRERPWPGAVLTRASRSYVRVGTFEYLAHQGQVEPMARLVQHLLEAHYPEYVDTDAPARTLLEAVGRRQAELVARWLAVGFIHGVMNTDNVSVVGETIDYGPCAFMDVYHPQKVFSSIDRYGRYAYANQPRIAHWNLAAFAQALLPLMSDVEEARAVIQAFPDQFAQAHLDQQRAKLGLVRADEADGALAADFLELLAAQEADFTRSFRALSHLDTSPSAADAALQAECKQPDALDPWLDRWRARLRQETHSDAERQQQMQATNPAVIPRNHRIEQMIQAAVAGDEAPLRTLLDVLSDPFTERAEYVAYQASPQSAEQVHQTFCGT